MVDITENKKLKKFVFDRLFDELYNKTYYPCGTDVWILDFNDNEWYFQYSSNGVLNYNRKFFDSFFRIYSFDQSQYQKILKNWFETTTEYQVNHISRRNLDISYYLEGIRNSENKKWSLNDRFGYGYHTIKKYLNIKKYLSEEKIKLEHFITTNGVY